MQVNTIIKALILIAIGILCGAGIVMLAFPNEREYEQIALKVSQSHDYNYPDFTCVDFSESLVQELTAKGYFAWEQTVDVPQENCPKKPCLHSVVALVIPIEATNGEILTPEKWAAYKYSWFGSADTCDWCLGGLKG